MFSWVGGQPCKPCGHHDPATDTVKFDPSGVISEQEQEKSRREAEERAQAIRREREAEERVQLERQRAEQAERKRQDELAAQMRRDKEKAEERARLERQRMEEEAEAARQLACEAEEKAREEERVRAERERVQKEEAEAKRQVTAWLSKNGYADVNAKKTKMFKASYPLHDAIKQGDADAVRLLIRFKADTTLKSSGQTPHALAQKINKKGSSQDVLTILTAQSQSRSLAGA